MRRESLTSGRLLLAEALNALSSHGFRVLSCVGAVSEVGSRNRRRLDGHKGQYRRWFQCALASVARALVGAKTTDLPASTTTPEPQRFEHIIA